MTELISVSLALSIKDGNQYLPRLFSVDHQSLGQQNLIVALYAAARVVAPPNGEFVLKTWLQLAVLFPAPGA